tara:strand:+ start:99 stop:443 length:345 start_codon:yes stop_codon:yes gene_type:complete
MRLDEPLDFDLNYNSDYNLLEFNDIDFDAQLEEIDTLYSELDILNKTSSEIEKVNDSIILYTMFNVYVIIAVCSTIITQHLYDTFNLIFVKIIVNKNNPTLHVSPHHLSYYQLD